MSFQGVNKRWLASDRSSYFEHNPSTAVGSFQGAELGMRRRVYNATSDATKTLIAEDSGALVCLNRAAGVVVTLPTASTGLWFDFLVLTCVTSNAYKVITGAATEFIKGVSGTNFGSGSVATPFATS